MRMRLSIRQRLIVTLAVPALLLIAIGINALDVFRAEQGRLRYTAAHTSFDYFQLISNSAILFGLLLCVASGLSLLRSIMQDICAASREQNIGIEQVNQAVTQMDQISQQNAALAEEAAAAAISLDQQAELLKIAVSQFQITACKS